MTATPTMLVLGGCVILLAALIGGATGAGDSVVSTALLLLLGVPLGVIVPVNLLLTLVTRTVVARRLRPLVQWPVAGWLLLGSVPGTYVGVRLLDVLPVNTTKIAVGAVLVCLAVVQTWSRSAPTTPGRSPRVLGSVGVVAGVFGAMASLNGLPPVLLLARSWSDPLRALATIAVFLCASSALALVLLTASGQVGPLVPLAVLLWMPGAVLGNWAGTSLAGRLPVNVFRHAVVVVAGLAGMVTIVAAV